MDRLDAVERRLARMEREVRWYRAGAAVALLAVAAGGLASAQAPASPPAPAEIRTRKLTLVGPQGEVRGVMQVAADGVASLALSDVAGNRRVALEAGVSESRVTVLGLGRTAATLANDAGVPRVAVADGSGQERVWVAVRLGSPVIQFLDASGAARTGITTFNDDTGLTLVSRTDGSKPGVVLMGNENKILWSAPQ